MGNYYQMEQYVQKLEEIVRNIRNDEGFFLAHLPKAVTNDVPRTIFGTGQYAFIIPGYFGAEINFNTGHNVYKLIRTKLASDEATKEMRRVELPLKSSIRTFGSKHKPRIIRLEHVCESPEDDPAPFGVQAKYLKMALDIEREFGAWRKPGLCTPLYLYCRAVEGSVAEGIIMPYWEKEQNAVRT